MRKTLFLYVSLTNKTSPPYPDADDVLVHDAMPCGPAKQLYTIGLSRLTYKSIAKRDPFEF